jgi:acetylornithine deacetylase/succinyl-diaminopimelate desuccinylase-like protein
VDTPDSLAKHVERGILVQMLQTLVRIPSVTGTEDAAQEQMARFLRELGGEVDAWRPDVAALRREPNFPTSTRTSIACTRSSRGSGSGGASSPGPCRAASSRCWRWRAR